MDQPEAGILLDRVSKAFGPQVALAGVDLEIEPGAYVAVMGANGAGKSTLLKAIAGLAAPTRGTVRVAGADMRRAGPRLRAMVGYVGHASMLYPDLTARENLTFYGRLFSLRDVSAAVAEVAAAFEVEHALDRQVRTLSRGTKQRVTLARALLHRPKVVLLDEPYTGLDEAAAVTLTTLLDGLHTSERILVVTLHDVARAMSGPERLVVLSAGRVALDVPIDGRSVDVADAYRSLLRSEVAS